jgi:hypothetical protein
MTDRTTRTEQMTVRISLDTEARLLAVMKWRHIPSKQEAVNRALAMWLEHEERCPRIPPRPPG